MRHRALAVLVPAITLLGSTAAGSSLPADIPSLRVTTASSRLQDYQPNAGGVTYDKTLAPTGAQLSVLGVSASQGTSVIFTVRGLLPKRQYGAHVHVKGCGPTPADSGPHFQNKKDPVQPSVNPVYANPRNEIWLDFTTDRVGSAIAVSHVPWGFGVREAGSIVVHATHTHTDPGHAGTAGARLACLNVAF